MLEQEAPRTRFFNRSPVAILCRPPFPVTQPVKTLGQKLRLLTRFPASLTVDFYVLDARFSASFVATGRPSPPQSPITAGTAVFFSRAALSRSRVPSVRRSPSRSRSRRPPACTYHSRVARSVARRRLSRVFRTMSLFPRWPHVLWPPTRFTVACTHCRDRRGGERNPRNCGARQRAEDLRDDGQASKPTITGKKEHVGREYKCAQARQRHQGNSNRRGGKGDGARGSVHM